jgi:hypothetical protein
MYLVPNKNGFPEPGIPPASQLGRCKKVHVRSKSRIVALGDRVEYELINQSINRVRIFSFGVGAILYSLLPLLFLSHSSAQSCATILSKFRLIAGTCCTLPSVEPSTVVASFACASAATSPQFSYAQLSSGTLQEPGPFLLWFC